MTLPVEDQLNRASRLPESLKQLSNTNMTVNAAVRMYLRGELEYTPMLESLAAVLARNAEELAAQLTDLANLSMRPTPIVLPHGASLIGLNEAEAQVSMPKLEKGSKVALNNFGTASGTYVVTRLKGDTISLEREQ